jgi:hypothetical protein
MAEFAKSLFSKATSSASAGVALGGAIGGAAVNAGFSLLQQVAIVPPTRNDSSDEENTVKFVETVDFINNGQSGIVAFKTIKNGQTKMVHVILQSGAVHQYFQQSKKFVAYCSEIQNVQRHADYVVSFEVKRSKELIPRLKKLQFVSDREAVLFHKYVEFLNESGKYTRKAFNNIDRRKTGFIYFDDLRLAFEKVDLVASDVDILKM